jgi:dipeptidyl aminopeptidase/acylaminoacyl peptidase
LLLHGAQRQVTGHDADLLKIRRVTQVEVAPSGSHAVFGVQSIETKTVSGDPQYRTHLFSIDLNDANAKPVQLTFGVRNDTGIAISPDGKQFAFLRPDEGKTQVWLMPLGMPGEARPVGKLENGPSSIQWRPDGKALLVSSSIPLSKIEGKPHFPLDRPQRDWNDADKSGGRPDGDLKEVRNWLEKNAAKSDPTATTRVNFLAEQGLETEMTIAQLFVLDVASGKAEQITKDFYDHRGAVWSPDGKHLAFVSTPPVKVHPDRISRRSIWMMNANGSDIHTLMDTEVWTYGSPRFSEDGKSLYFTGTETADEFFKQARLGRVDLGSKTVQWLANEWPSAVQSPKVSGGAVYFTSSWQGAVPLHRVNSDGKVEALGKGQWEFRRWISPQAALSTRKSAWRIPMSCFCSTAMASAGS